jgi:hypothetical protein
MRLVLEVLVRPANWDTTLLATFEAVVDRSFAKVLVTELVTPFVVPVEVEVWLEGRELLVDVPVELIGTTW